MTGLMIPAIRRHNIDGLHNPAPPHTRQDVIVHPQAPGYNVPRSYDDPAVR